jgi:hypothetical protein
MTWRKKTAIPKLNQKLTAFEGMLPWAKGIVRQADRVSHARVLMRNLLSQFPRESGIIYSAEPIRDVGHLFKVERHLFCNAAGQFVDHRRWLGRIGDFDENVFAEIDLFEPDVKAMRNLNEHAIEYLEG